jgi:four helix bundle protein
VASFADLDAYKLAVSLADDLRAVGANLAEGLGRSSPADQQRFMLFARGSVYETQHWIERAFKRSLLTDDAFRERAASVGRLVNGLHRAHRRRATSN